MTVISRATLVEPDHRLAMTFTLPAMRGWLLYTFTPIRGGTKLRQEETLVFRGVLRPFSGFVGGMLGPRLQQRLEDIKELMERREPVRVHSEPGCAMLTAMKGDERIADDEQLLSRAEEALTEIKVSTGLSEVHEAVLAALRIRLKGDAGSSLEDLLAAADDPKPPRRDNLLDRPPSPPSSTFDDLLSKPQRPKRSLDDLLGSSGDDSDLPAN